MEKYLLLELTNRFTDGIIVKGRTSINEAPVTGESIPVEKKEGMKVFFLDLLFLINKKIVYLPNGKEAYYIIEPKVVDCGGFEPPTPAM